MLAAAEGRERQPRRLHLRDIVGQRPPPQRLVQRRLGRAWPLGVRVDEQRHAPLGDALAGSATHNRAPRVRRVLPAGSDTPTQPAG